MRQHVWWHDLRSKREIVRLFATSLPDYGDGALIRWGLTQEFHETKP